MSKWDSDSELPEAISVDLAGTQKVMTVTVQKCQHPNNGMWQERMILLINMSQLYGLKPGNGDEC